MIRVLFSAPSGQWEKYQQPLQQALDDAGIAAAIACDHPAEDVDFIVFAPGGPVQDFTRFTRCKAVLGLWAGVESIVTNPTLTQPLTRMVDRGLTQGMVEWVAGHVLRLHLGMDVHLFGQDGVWRDAVPPLAKDRPVTILGLGTLGMACGQALAHLGFDVTGWSASPKDADGLRCLHGLATLETALGQAQIIVLLLPLTDDTRHIINANRLAQLPRGAMVVNPGRGPLIEDTALLAALDSGHIAQATLDVFATEPLPPAHTYWAHPRVTVTPHIASATRPDTASQAIVENIRRSLAGVPLLHLVDRARGY